MTMTAKGRDRSGRAFTLVELLVVVAIISLLAALLIPSVLSGKRRAVQMQCMNCMKQVGQAIQMYVNDHEDYLPGPIDVGVSINYTRTSTQVLPYHLARYLGLPMPATIASSRSEMARPLVCAGYAVDSRKVMSSGTLQARCYSLNWSTNTTRDAALPWKAFGYNAVPQQPHRLSEVFEVATPMNAWAMQDVDQSIILAKNWDWYPNLPREATHRTSWNRLYFDWHVDSVRNPDKATTGNSYAP